MKKSLHFQFHSRFFHRLLTLLRYLLNLTHPSRHSAESVHRITIMWVGFLLRFYRVKHIFKLLSFCYDGAFFMSHCKKSHLNKLFKKILLLILWIEHHLIFMLHLSTVRYNFPEFLKTRKFYDPLFIVF